MLSFSGQSVCKGIAIGQVVVFRNTDNQVKRINIRDWEHEIERVKLAVAQSMSQLQDLYEKVRAEAGEDSAAIFKAHRLIIEDKGFLDGIYERIASERVNAEYAVSVIGDHFAKAVAGVSDEYMKARAIDIKDISKRLIRNLLDVEEMDFTGMETAIIVAEDLSPSEVAKLSKSTVRALVTVYGSVYSHTAILAKTKSIPLLVQVPLDLEVIHTGMTAIVDGTKEQVTFEPEETVYKEVEARIAEEQETQSLLHSLKGKANVTRDGRKIEIVANVGSLEDVECALEHDAGGIGLFRSEFLYLGRADIPTEEEQFQVYKQALQMMAGKKVVIRTLDIGADKQVACIKLQKEDNPALGYRGIRICLKQPEIFRPQLRALLRAAVYGNLSIMYPMITSIEEMRQIQEILGEVQTELIGEAISYKVPEQGIMIETPAAVMISDELAEMVDFFSIGTNDLTQYTLAVDRQNEKVNGCYSSHHKSVMRMIEMTVNSAHRAGKRVGICGELGGDTELTETFLRMGVDELSVIPTMVLEIRKKVREI